MQVPTVKHWLSLVGAAVLILTLVWSAGFTDKSSDEVHAPTEAVPSESPSPRAPVSVNQPIPPVAIDAVLPKTPQRLLLVSTSPGRNVGDGTAQIGTDAKHLQTYAHLG